MEKLKDEIMYAFRKSGKRHIVITGSKGSGKSTLASLICKAPKSGFRTKVKPYESVVMENIASGERCLVGVYDGSACKMKPSVGGFDEFGVEAVNGALKDRELSLFDEIGYLETDISGFTRAFEKMLDEKACVACVRREKTSFIERICTRDDVFMVDLETFKSGISLVIMASGLSRRFGENKLLCEFENKRLIEHILISTAGLFEKRAVVTRTPELKEICDMYGFDCIVHSLPDRSDTIRLGLEYSGGSDGVMFCPSDQPKISRQSLILLSEAFRGDRDKIYRLSFGDNAGLPTVFPRKYYAELTELEAGGGKAVIKKHMYDVVNITAQSRVELFDIDTKSDLIELNKTKF